MFGFETGIAGGFALILMLLVGLVFVLDLFPSHSGLPLGRLERTWGSSPSSGCAYVECRPARWSRRGSARSRPASTSPLNDLEAHYLAGGNVVRVVNAMIQADKANIALPFKRAAAIDLAGRDVLEAVKMSVIPKVIETPKIAAAAKDGIQLIAVSRVTVRTNLDRLVGGAGEETVIARVGEGIVTAIGSAETHKDVLDNPDQISKCLEQGLDAGTAFEISPSTSPMWTWART